MQVRPTRPHRLVERYGPWAVVRGASSGIGGELTQQLAQAGMNLGLVARRQQILDEIAADLRARLQVEVRVVGADLSTPAGVDAVILGSENLNVALFVAAAGFGTAGRFLRADLQRECAMLDVNCRALLALSLHFGRRFAERGRGGIILMAYVQSLAEGLHVELKPHGVDVLASAPGPVRSGFADRSGMRMAVALTPTDIADETLAALGRRMTACPERSPRSSRIRSHFCRVQRGCA